MIQLLKTSVGYVLQAENGDVMVGSAEFLLALRRRLNEWADTLVVDGDVAVGQVRGDWIGTRDAKALAQQAGVKLETAAINAACQRGNLPARKSPSGGRWEFRLSDFQRWFAQHKLRKQ